MSDTPSSVQLHVPRIRVAADLVGMVRHLAQAGIQGALLQDWPGLVTNLLAAVNSVRFQRTEASLAWQLLLTGIGEALTELANEQPPVVLKNADVTNIVRQTQRQAEDFAIPVDFLDHPWNLQPVTIARRNFLTFVVSPEGTLANLHRRFDSALVLSLHRTIRQNEARYRPVLALRENPTV